MKHNKNTYSFQTLSFIFDDDIEKVYKSFFTPKILYKAGIIGTILEVNHYEITTNTADNAKVKGINYKFCKISQIYNPNLEQDISGLLDSLILAIDNFDLDYANEAIDHLLRYPLKIEYISLLNFSFPYKHYILLFS